MISVKVIDIYISLSLFFVICTCIGGAVVNYVWRRRFDRKVIQGVRDGNEKREDMIYVLDKRAKYYESEAGTYRKRALEALKIINRLKIDTTRTANMSPERLEELLVKVSN